MALYDLTEQQVGAIKGMMNKYYNGQQSVAAEAASIVDVLNALNAPYKAPPVEPKKPEPKKGA